MTDAKTPRLRMSHAGADWLRQNLSYSKKPRTISAFGESVADLLGYCWSGLYHLRPDAIERANWEDERWIMIGVGPSDLATWDFNTLTQLVVLGHDMGIRVSVHPAGTRGLKLGFGAREGRYVFGDTDSCMARQHPSLEDHVAAIRKGYEVEQPQQQESASP